MIVATRRFITGSAALAALVFSTSAVSAQTAAAVCKDGTTTAAAGRGACSGHGGVNKAASKAAARTVKTEVKAAKAITKKAAGTRVSAVCSDGTTSNARGRGTCSGHGGVKGAEVTSKTTGRALPVPATAKPPKIVKAAPVPRASARAVTRANSNSAVVGNGSADDNNPKGAVAQCKDGLYSHAANHQGACGHHGGVARWM